MKECCDEDYCNNIEATSNQTSTISSSTGATLLPIAPKEGLYCHNSTDIKAPPLFEFNSVNISKCYPNEKCLRGYIIILVFGVQGMLNTNCFSFNISLELQNYE